MTSYFLTGGTGFLGRRLIARLLARPGCDAVYVLVRESSLARFDALADYLKRRQPPSLMIWARHDPFFELAEIMSWMQALPRMEAHILDAGHKLLETHAAAAAALMVDFVRQTQREREGTQARE